MYSEHVRVLCNLMSAFIIMRTELATEIKGHAYYSPTVTSLEKPQINKVTVIGPTYSKCTKASDLLYDGCVDLLFIQMSALLQLHAYCFYA